MAKTCTSCGQAANETAQFCETCGRRFTSTRPPNNLPTDWNKGHGKFTPSQIALVFAALIVAAFVILVAVHGGGSTIQETATVPGEARPAMPPPDSATKVTADVLPPQIPAAALVQEYEANEINADRLYKGRQLFVVGHIGDIKKDILDNPYMTLDGIQDDFRSVQAFFSEDMLPELARLHKGQFIGVVGTCDGLMMNVLIKHCRLVRLDQFPVNPQTEPTAVESSVTVPSREQAQLPADPPTGSAAEKPPPSSAIPPDIHNFLERWRTSILKHDLEAQVDCYAPVVEVFFRKSNVPQNEIRKDKEAMFNEYPDIRLYTISDPTVESVAAENAIVTFRKEWDVRGARQFAGAERQRLTLRRLDGHWKIVGEQELQIFWVRKNGLLPK